MVFRLILVISVITVGSLPNECKAQKKPDTLQAGIFYEPQESPPEFPGGFVAFQKFIAANLRHIDGAEGQKAILNFVIEKDGSLTAIKVARGISAAADTEAVRVIRLLPKWKPGTQSNTLVRVAYAIPITFK